MTRDLGSLSRGDRLTLRIVSVVGTRPEAIKIAPVARAAARRGFEHVLVGTGQHAGIFHGALDSFDLTADHDLGLGGLSGGLDVIVDAIGAALPSLLDQIRPDIVLVQGDTNTALAAAQVAHRSRFRIGHIEAGLRTHDLQRPFPEEGNRIAIDAIADMLFAPTRIAHDNLVNERCWGTIFITGNTGIDALLSILPTLPPQNKPRDGLLVTLHRRETIGEPLRAICAMLRKLVILRDIKITLPLHSNPNVRGIILEELDGDPMIRLVEPLDYRAMIMKMREVVAILSDSGGVQEEAPALGTPLLVLRDITERPEAIQSGNAILAGTDPDAILAHALSVLDDAEKRAALSKPAFPFGDGTAAEKILHAIENYIPRPNVT